MKPAIQHVTPIRVSPIAAQLLDRREMFRGAREDRRRQLREGRVHGRTSTAPENFHGATPGRRIHITSDASNGVGPKEQPHALIRPATTEFVAKMPA